MDKSDYTTLYEPPRKSVTLEEMIVELELREEIARKEKASNFKFKEEMNFPRRMSCVNNSDILRSEQNTLNKYPRFSLDGREAMKRSSFRKNVGLDCPIDGLKLGRILHLPHSVGGESVIWCKPGVVPKLMGLEVMPLTMSKLYKSKGDCNRDAKHKLCNDIKSHNLRRGENIVLGKQQSKYVNKDLKVCGGDTKKFGYSGGGGGRSDGSRRLTSSKVFFVPDEYI